MLATLLLATTSSQPMHTLNAPVEVLSVFTIKVGERDIKLPLVRMDDGSVCQSYLGKVSSQESSTERTVSIEQVCDQPVYKPDNLGQVQVYPKKLLALPLVQTKDMLYHDPVIAVEVPKTTK